MKCIVCGEEQREYIYKSMITGELSQSWHLTKHEAEGFNRRESGFCRHCGSSTRGRYLAQAIVKCIPFRGLTTFSDWVEKANQENLAIAEINYCAQLHPYLERNYGTRTSQFREQTLRARLSNWLKGIRQEDITNLSYKSHSFDLVIHSEVLEHVEDTEKALAECRRILKPSGICLFTVPIIMDRKTKKKVWTDKRTGNSHTIEVPSYHGSGEPDNLVYWEFGGDFIETQHLQIVVQNPVDFIYVLKMTNLWES